jgi:dolichyl-diphosphooligosaccharide--protein glycosyltransferase
MVNPLRLLAFSVLGVGKLVILSYWCLRAYRIRLHAVNTYGYIIHEFDPWFNYRATEYMAEHGWHAFFHWFDYMSWYPIGRAVGTTTYPGMQFTAVAIWQMMKHIPARKVKIPKEILARVPKWSLAYFPNKGRPLSFGPMSLNDVCVMAPAWFGAVATFFTFMLATELSGSTTAGLFAAFIMSIIPAHIMRSVAGGWDNEAIAVSAFILVFYLWVRSVRTPRSWPFGILCGITYGYAAAVWGGYIFVNNLLAIHAAFLVVIGKYTIGLYRSYTLMYIIGTFLATRVPPIGWAPFRAIEQMPSLLTFIVFQLMAMCDFYRSRQKQGMSGWKFCAFRIVAFAFAAAVAAAISFVLFQLGVFMPLGARIRGLFLEAVKTGNPLVDSVAEHQPANDQAYDMYLNKARFLAAFGLLFCWHQPSPGKFMAFLYAAVAYHYSLKMSRLVLICGPIVSVLAGFPIGIIGDWCVEQILGLVSFRAAPIEEEAPTQLVRSGGMGSIWRFLWRHVGPLVNTAELRDLIACKEWFATKMWFIDRPLRAIIAWMIIVVTIREGKSHAKEFIEHCDMIAPRMSNPHLMFLHQQQGAGQTIISDYFDGYKWVDSNTPKDSRVIAWWDYGYQITGIAKRTSIADGNTWNHEHIATLGRILTSNEKKSHKAMRHIADYALVWAGGQGDDLGKSPHLARIGNSVFPDHCGDDDPLCNKFSFFRDGTPTPMMKESFLYRAVKHNLEPGIFLNNKLWKEVHTTKYGLMRVFKVLNVSQESKKWVANPRNRICDAPGSWYCVGQYPPALKPLIAKRRNFAQLEDFNKKGESKSAYTKLIEEQRTGKKKSSERDEADL